MELDQCINMDTKTKFKVGDIIEIRGDNDLYYEIVELYPKNILAIVIGKYSRKHGLYKSHFKRTAEFFELTKTENCLFKLL